ncbi:hypothetical protein F5887DRAFT_973984 [Amanita rubescens]|nr:hypothetical protein F5887DRAFT_973984 [Amanita rubescens]
MAPILNRDTIVVNDSEPGVQFAYTDTGPPSQSSYITIVAIHGMAFCSPVFKRVQNVAIKQGVRFVALNRRNYPGSTPYTPEEINALLNGTKEQRDGWHKDRGHEVGVFIYKLIEKGGIPPISADRKTGGIVIHGWSAGAGDASAMIAYADTLPEDVRSRLALYMRALIIQDSHSVMFGASPDPTEHSPLIDEQLSPEGRLLKFYSWVTGYFKHGDISTQDVGVLSGVEPSDIRPLSIDNMTAEEQKEIIYAGKETEYELPYMLLSKEQFYYAYRTAFMGDSVRTLFPGFKASFLAGELSPAFGIRAYWLLGNDLKESGKSFGVRLVPDSNHFLHWDDPEEALKIYLECS